jgi:hypothetical protein
MDKAAYIQLLKGGKQYKNSNLYTLPNKASTVEERAAGRVCPPLKLNPDYSVNPKLQRVGKIVPRTQPRRRQRGQQQIHSNILRLIYGER